jgi:hypothetical protein
MKGDFNSQTKSVAQQATMATTLLILIGISTCNLACSQAENQTQNSVMHWMQHRSYGPAESCFSRHEIWSEGNTDILRFASANKINVRRDFKSATCTSFLPTTLLEHLVTLPFQRRSHFQLTLTGSSECHTRRLSGSLRQQ